MAEQKFIDGVKAFKPKADFIKVELVISLNQFVKFCKDNPSFLTEYNGEKQLKIQIKESKNGTWYAALNEYKKEVYDDRKNPLINAARGRDTNGINNDELNNQLNGNSKEEEGDGLPF